VLEDPEETFVQEDRAVRHWRYVPELGYYLRVVTKENGSLLNAFEDRTHTRRRRKQ
jgi:hypothetical protein